MVASVIEPSYPSSRLPSTHLQDPHRVADKQKVILDSLLSHYYYCNGIEEKEKESEGEKERQEKEEEI